jgi:ribulose-phosphate 3-epimerase
MKIALLFLEDGMKTGAIGKIEKKVKIAAGLFWADYGNLGAQVRELAEAGVDWIHLEMRDGRYMNFNAPRGGLDVLMGIRPHTDLEIEVQLQMVRPTFDLYRQLKDNGADLISLPIETTMENLIQDITYIKDKLELKVGVWGWQGLPVLFFEQYIPFVDIIEYESRARFWSTEKGRTPHVLDDIMVTSLRRMHDMIVEAGREREVDLMEDGGIGASNSDRFVEAGMTVGEYSSALLKGPDGEGPGGRFAPGSGRITKAVEKLQQALKEAADLYRGEDGCLKS